MIFFAAIFSQLATFFLALSQTRHWKRVVKATLPAFLRFKLRLLACFLLVLSLIFCLLAEGASFSALIWPLLFFVTSLLTAMSLAYKPHILEPLARCLNYFYG